jgi:hypothetical protein
MKQETKGVRNPERARRAIAFIEKVLELGEEGDYAQFIKLAEDADCNELSMDFVAFKELVELTGAVVAVQALRNRVAEKITEFRNLPPEPDSPPDAFKDLNNELFGR